MANDTYLHLSIKHYWIQNYEDFIKAEQVLFSHKSMAIDMEFYRRDTFASQLCLILIAHSNGIFVIDALNVTIKPILKVLLHRLSTQHQLVFHSSLQDLEIFDDICQQLPTDFIDIQYSGVHLQLSSQPSLNCLAEKILSLSKCNQAQTSDWRKRPMSEKQLNYAFAESEIIWECYQQLKQQLTQYQWQAISEKSDYCLQSHCKSKDLVLQSEHIGDKLKLDPNQQKRLLSLLKWRLAKAQQYDFPISWILSNQQIQQLTKQPQLQKKIIGFNSKCQKYRSQIKPQLRTKLQQELSTLL